MSKQVVVYGAGQTGRGYVARFLKEKDYQITFIEKNERLIYLINEDKKFSIHFYHEDRTPFIVDNITAYAIDEDISESLKSADLIITSVGEQNLHEVAHSIASHLKPNQTPQLLTCENGINPAKVLKQHLVNEFTEFESVSVSQTAVFCSTVNVSGTRLDIFSQNETYFPYDSEGFDGELDFNGAEPICQFENFLKRKIYTYNCLAGLISYLGYVKGYKIYADAANDAEIAQLMDDLLTDLNPVLADYFSVTLPEQQAFAQKAVAKFKDEKILDYVIKNGRAAKRKLGKTERIFAPYTIMKEQGITSHILLLVAGAALTYLEEIETPAHSIEANAVLTEILELPENDSFIVKSVEYYEQLRKDRKQLSLLEILDTQD